MPLMTGLSPFLTQPLAGVGQPGPTYGGLLNMAVQQGSAPGSQDPAAYGMLMQALNMGQPQQLTIADLEKWLSNPANVADNPKLPGLTPEGAVPAETTVWQDILKFLGLG